MSHGSPGGSQACEQWSVRRFVCAPYGADERGRMRPVSPVAQCPWSESVESCRIGKKGFRKRKTGPQFPKEVLYCGGHRRHFTVYPMGHVPYGRVCMGPVDPGGYGLEVGAGAGAAGRFCRWRGTLF